MFSSCIYFSCVPKLNYQVFCFFFPVLMQSELYHWSAVLDIFDDVLASCTGTEWPIAWLLPCDRAENVELKQLLLQVSCFVVDDHRVYSPTSSWHCTRWLMIPMLCSVVQYYYSEKMYKILCNKLIIY